MAKRKPNGYWKDWNNVEQELTQIIEELGHFPTQKEFQERSQSSLHLAFSKYHGGVRAVRERIGHSSLMKPAGYWKEWSNVEQELETVIAELGHFPKQQELREKTTGLNSAISEHHGGISAVRERMGYDPTTKSNNYWKEWSNVEQELETVIAELGHFPKQQELRERKVTSLSQAMHKYHGGVNIVREKMGYDQTMKPPNYWKNWDNVEQELRPLIKELGHFPTTSDLEKKEKACLRSAILNHHGGLITTRERMGYKPAIRPPGYWTKWEHVQEEIEAAIELLGHFPSDQEFRSLKLSSVITAINRAHGGINAVRQRMGYEEGEKSKGYWQQWEHVETELSGLTEKLGHFPSSKELNGQNKSGLREAIYRDFGGLVEVRERMGYDLTKRPHGYWKNWTNVERELEGIIDELGHFPSYTELQEQSQAPLYQAMCKYHGGVDVVQIRMENVLNLPSEKQQLEQLLETYAKQ